MQAKTYRIYAIIRKGQRALSNRKGTIFLCLAKRLGPFVNNVKMHWPIVIWRKVLRKWWC